MSKNQAIRRCAALMWMALVLAYSSVAFGGDSERETRAREFMAEGLKAQKRDDLDGAKRAYLKSYEVYPSYDVAGNLGMVEVELKDYPSAANHLAYCLRNFPTGENRDLKKLVEEHFEKARQFVGGVKFNVPEPGVTVRIDDEAIGTSPFENILYIRAGYHAVSAEKDGRKAEESLTVERGKETEIELRLPKPAVAPVPDVDSGLDETERPVERKRPSLVPAYILGGVSVAALGTSFVFRGLAGGKKKDIDELNDADDDGTCVDSDNGRCSDLNKAIDTHKTYATISHGTLIGGGVLAAATIGYVTYVLTKKDRRVQAGLSIDDGGGILTLGGSF